MNVKNQTDLFLQQPSGAIFSKHRNYRYVLWRIWDNDLTKIMFIGLNPSTANEADDDATMRRVKSFAKSFGYGGVYMLNLFAFITKKPKILQQCKNPIGDSNFYLKQYAGKSDKGCQ